MFRRWPLVVLLACAPAGARPPRPQLSEPSRAALAKAPLFLVPEDNLAIPLTAGAKGFPFLSPAPQALAIIRTTPEGDSLLWADGEAYRLHGDALSSAASLVGAQATASSDGKVFVGIDDKKGIKVTIGGVSRAVKHHRLGRWELEHPRVSPDGRFALVTLRDYSNPNLDEFSFLALETKGGDPEEIALSNSFAPGAFEQWIGADQVVMRMFAQSNDEDGAPVMKEAGMVVFDFKTRKLSPAPDSLKLGVASPKGHHLMLPGPVVWGDGRQCSGDETTLFLDGGKRGATLRLGEGTIVSVLDFLPDERAVIANVLELKSCRNHGALIPLQGDLPPAKWPSFALPVRVGRVSGRVLYPAASPSKSP